jgi:hypothetical protein
LNGDKKMAITPVGQTDNNVSGVTGAAITQDIGAPSDNSADIGSPGSSPIEQYDNGHNCYSYGSRRGDSGRGDLETQNNGSGNPNGCNDHVERYDNYDNAACYAHGYPRGHEEPEPQACQKEACAGYEERWTNPACPEQISDGRLD